MVFTQENGQKLRLAHFWPKNVFEDCQSHFSPVAPKDFMKKKQRRTMTGSVRPLGEPIIKDLSLGLKTDFIRLFLFFSVLKGAIL